MNSNCPNYRFNLTLKQGYYTTQTHARRPREMQIICPDVCVNQSEQYHVRVVSINPSATAHLIV